MSAVADDDARPRFSSPHWWCCVRPTPSGIFVVRVPEGLRWPGEVCPDVELVSFAYRYAIVGHDAAALTPTNMGRHGARAGRKALARHFKIADQALAHWPIRVVLNVSDFILASERYPLVQRWCKLLEHYGYVSVREVKVRTQRQRHGAKGAAGMDQEMVLVALQVGP